MWWSQPSCDCRLLRHSCYQLNVCSLVQTKQRRWASAEPRRPTEKSGQRKKCDLYFVFPGHSRPTHGYPPWTVKPVVNHDQWHGRVLVPVQGGGIQTMRSGMVIAQIFGACRGSFWCTPPFAVQRWMPVIHSFFSLSYDRTIASPTTNTPHSAFQCLRFQFPASFLFFSLTSYSSYLRLLSRPPVSSIPYSIYA